MNVSRIFSAAMLACAIASPAAALEVKRSITVAAAPEETWKAIGDFCGIASWHPAITKCDMVKNVKDHLRVLTLADGATVVEKQINRNDTDRVYSYAIVNDSPIPVNNYVSVISVKKSGKGSTIHWSGSFVAKGAPDDKAAEVIGGVYDAGLASLQKKLGQ